MLYVMSDIHGNQRRFDSVLQQIHLQAQDTLYVLGDVIDRHPHGIALLQRLMDMPNVKMLLGNHEYMMLRALGHPYDDHVDTGTALPHWYRNGGSVTHEHFLQLSAAEQERLLQYLLSLPLFYDVQCNGQRYKLVHATAPEDFAHNTDARYPNRSHFSLWKRWDAPELPRHDYTMVFGHTPTRHYQDCVPMTLYRQEGIIGIDCGSGYPEEKDNPNRPYGRLCCLRLDDGAEFYSTEEIE